MKQVTVFIAESNFLVRKGWEHIVERQEGFRVTGTASTGEELLTQAAFYRPDILVVNYRSMMFRQEDIRHIKKHFGSIRLLAVTPDADPMEVRHYIRMGLDGHLLYSCDEDEIVEALETLGAGGCFYCGKVLEAIEGLADEAVTCRGANLTERETEIVKHIAAGMSNKQIAEKLSLSVYTVQTHRKNIMRKIGARNTAGVVSYAISERIN